MAAPAVAASEMSELGDAAHAGVDDARRDLIGAKLVQRRGDGFHRPLHVALDDERELFLTGAGKLAHHLFERTARSGADGLQIANLADAILGDFTGAGLALHDGELIARLRSRVEAQHLHRHRGPGLAHMGALVVDQGAHPAPGPAGDHDLPDPERAALHEHGAHGTTAALQLGLDDHAIAGTVRIGLQLQDFRLEVNRFQQLVEIRALLGGDLHFEGVAAHALDHDAVLQQLGAHPVRVRVELVDLVDRNDQRNIGRPGVIDGLDGLRHDAVIGGHHQHNDIGHLGAASAHGGERGVTRRVDKRDRIAPVGHHLISADMLGDAARLAGHHIGVAQSVEQRRLAMVHVAHDGDDRSARLEMLDGVGLANETFLHVGFGHPLDGVPELLGEDLRRVGVDHVVDLVHLPLLHQELDKIDGALRHTIGELLDGDGFRQLNFAGNFLTWLLTEGLLLQTFALTPQGRERAFPLAVHESVGDGELRAGAPIVGRLDGGTRRLDLGLALGGVGPRSSAIALLLRDRAATGLDLGGRSVAAGPPLDAFLGDHVLGTNALLGPSAAIPADMGTSAATLGAGSAAFAGGMRPPLAAVLRATLLAGPRGMSPSGGSRGRSRRRSLALFLHGPRLHDSLLLLGFDLGLQPDSLRRSCA